MQFSYRRLQQPEAGLWSQNSNFRRRSGQALYGFQWDQADQVASLGFTLKMRCYGGFPTSLRRPIFFFDNHIFLIIFMFLII